VPSNEPYTIQTVKMDGDFPLIETWGTFKVEKFNFNESPHGVVKYFAKQDNYDNWAEDMLIDASLVKWAITNKAGGGGNDTTGDYVPAEVTATTTSSTITNAATGVNTIVKTSDSSQTSIQIKDLLQLELAFEGNYVDTFYTLAKSEYDNTNYEIYLRNPTGDYECKNMTTFTPNMYDSNIYTFIGNNDTFNNTITRQSFYSEFGTSENSVKIELKNTKEKYDTLINIERSIIEIDIKSDATSVQSIAYAKFEPGNINFSASNSINLNLKNSNTANETNIIITDGITTLDSPKIIIRQTDRWEIEMTTEEFRTTYKTEDMFYCVPRSNNYAECDFYVKGSVHAENIQPQKYPRLGLNIMS
jgi:hypothetical protein